MMSIIKLFTSQEGRKIRHFINAWLKSGAINKIKRFNYVKSYELVDNKIQKTEEKLLIIYFDDTNKNKLDNLIKKNLVDYEIAEI